MSTTAVHPQPVLADLLPAVRWRSIALVAAGALLTALTSQIRIPLGFTPVPINLATFSVALTGGALGARRGVTSMGLYLAAGIVGLPFFANASSGWDTVTGATGGYLVAYPILAAVVGLAADHGRDRHLGTFIVAIVAGNAMVYTLGALWLAHILDVPMFGLEDSAFSMGVRPFLAGDLAKMLGAGMLFPATWRLLGDR